MFYKTLAIGIIDGTMVIDWTRKDRVLQSTDKIGGTWLDMIGAFGPLVIDQSGAGRFFRVRAD